MFTCDICGKIAEDNVKRISFSHMFNLPFSKGHWMPENIFDVCEDCGTKVLKMIQKNENQEELHADR